MDSVDGDGNFTNNHNQQQHLQQATVQPHQEHRTQSSPSARNAAAVGNGDVAIELPTGQDEEEEELPRLLCWQAKDGARREQYDEVDLANMMTTRNPIFNNVIISRPSSVCGPRQDADISGSGGGGGDGGEEEQVDGRRRRRQETSMAAEERTHNQQHHKKSLIKSAF